MAPDFSLSYATAGLGEHEALNEITRLTALALQDQGLRQRVRTDMRNSRHTEEHKLHFSNYLEGQNGGILLAKMVKESGRSRVEVLDLIRSVRPLEFYMPVTQHRESWRGGADLLVASLLEDETDAPIGYTLTGHRVVLSAATPPETPVLAIVPVETDFSHSLDPRRYRNVNDNGGESIGTLSLALEPIDDDCVQPMGMEEHDALMCGGGGGGGGGTTTKPGGLYMIYSSLIDDGESWLKGNPEIEVHVHGPDGSGGTHAVSLSCAGEKQTNHYRYFDQNNKTWSGEVLLFTQSEITNYNTKYPGQGFNVMMWEDDDGPCVIKTDKDMTLVLAGIAGVVGAAAVIIEKPGSLASWVKAAGMFIGATYASASWLKSNDDFLGAAPQVTTNATRTDLYLSNSKTNGFIHTELRYMQ
jgi:hypothetical protein